MAFMIFKVFFWMSLGILVYVYFIFVVILLSTSKFRNKPVRKKEILPSISLIICAYNEEKHIRKKIENCLELDYPKDQMEIIVVSDGSTDCTNAILNDMNHPLIKTHCLPERSGKTACQNVAVDLSSNDVLFFTDATILHPPNALKLLLRSLYDPSVGCVTGKPIFNRDEGLTSKGLSKRETYELYLRSQLSGINSLFGATDCMYAIPRQHYCPVRPDLDSGFVGPLKVLEKGYRTVYEPEALALVARPAPTMNDEFIRRSRIVLRGMRGLLHMRSLMNPFKYGFLALSLISTRLLRWLTPVFLFLLLMSNVFLLGSPFYRFTFLLQVGFYLAAFTAFLLERKGYKLGSIFCIPLYFCILAGSAAVGLKRLLTGETGQTWQTRR
jgi:cellulose synthase/poly-beta-1,6-N-acetylglucosamine synthase-like glycosyltransferase